MGKLSAGNQPITHRTKYAEKQWEEMLSSGDKKGKYRCPDGLTIVTCHNYEEETLLEKNLKYLGIEGLVVLKGGDTPWRSVCKVDLVLDWIAKQRTLPAYLMVCDARDVIIRDDPRKIIEIFESMDCELVFNSTMFKGGWMCMPDKFEWYRRNVYKGRYLNAGVYIGRPGFISCVLKRALNFIGPDSISDDEYFFLGRGNKNTRLCEHLPDYPRGSTDQDIFRYIHSEFYPGMKVDCDNQLVYRN